MTNLLFFVMSEYTFVASYETTGLDIQESCLYVLLSLICHFSIQQKQNFGNCGAIEMLLNIIKSKLPVGSWISNRLFPKQKSYVSNQ